MPDPIKTAIIVAGGTGSRMGNAIPKQFLPLAGKPILIHTLDAFYEAFEDINIILVIAANEKVRVDEMLNPLAYNRLSITEGGESRFHSVKNGLKLITKESIVFVHDAVRCLVSVALIHRCYDTAISKGNAIPAILPTDSYRMIINEFSETIDRTKLRIIQTPQTFSSDVLLKAFEQPYSAEFTDEASVVEKSGTPVNLIEGEITNIKVTHPSDLILAGHILKERLSVE